MGQCWDILANVPILSQKSTFFLGGIGKFLHLCGGKHLNPFSDMHKTLLIFLLSWAAIASAQNNDARIEQSIERANATIKGRFNELSIDKLPDFYKVWSEASERYSQVSRNATCDMVIQMIFDKYLRVKKPYVVIPASIRVKVCNKKLGVPPNASEGYEYGHKSWEMAKQPDVEYLYVPHLTTDKKVLYEFGAVDKLLDSYLDMKTEKKLLIMLDYDYDKKERQSEIEKSISFYHSDLDGWRAIDDPHIHDITMFLDGICISFSSDLWSHYTVFIPKETKKLITISYIVD